MVLGRDDEAWAVPSSVLGAGSSHRVPSEVGLAGAGLTIPLALLQRRLGNDLGLKQHNTFLNAVYEEEPGTARPHRRLNYQGPGTGATSL